MLLKQYLFQKHISKNEMILLKHNGSKEPFRCCFVSSLTCYELDLKVIEELLVGNIKSYLYRQEALNKCTHYFVVAPRTILNKSTNYKERNFNYESKSYWKKTRKF